MSGGKGGGAGLEDLLGMLTGGSGGAQGLGALVERLRQGGLGEEVDSWVGTGANKPVAPDRLAAAFGPDELAGIQQRFGSGAEDTGGDIMGSLAALLPQLINGLTPQGQVPQSDAEFGSGGMGGVLSQLLGATGGAQAGGGGGGLGALLGALAGGGGAAAGGGLAGLLGGLMGGGEQGKPDPGEDAQTGPAKSGSGGPAPSGKPGLGGDGGGPLPQKPQPLR